MNLSLYKYLLLILIYSVNPLLYAQKINITGTYQGKDLYIKNQYCSDSIFCLEKILVNDKEIKVKLTTGGIHLPLSHLKMNEKIIVTLYHLPDCQPKFLNPQVISGQEFKFKEIKIENNTIEFETSKEKPGAIFYLYKWENQNWMEDSFYTITNVKQGRYFTFPVRNSSAKYRIKYHDPKTGVMYFSPEISFPY